MGNSKWYVMHNGRVTPFVTKRYSSVGEAEKTKCLALHNYCYTAPLRNVYAIGARNILVLCIQATILKWNTLRFPQIRNSISGIPDHFFTASLYNWVKIGVQDPCQV